MLDNELKGKINQLWDKFWSGGISNPLTAIEQMSYLLFMKRIEDEDVSNQQNASLSGEKYNSVFPKTEYKWSVWSEYSADKILNHVRNTVFPFMQNLGKEDSLYQKYMKNAVFSLPTPSLLIEAVKIINEMHIKEQNRDTQGDIYEFLLSELKTAGKNGQFRTPRHIIKMMVELVNPQCNDSICDPACGTAGFLISAYEHILENNTSKDLIKKDAQGNKYNFKADKLNENQWKMLKESTFYGFDIDQTMTRISLMNLMMHGITKPNIQQLNTLSVRFTESNYYDIILANPPFKGSIDESEISERFTITTKKTEILFLELMYNLLNNGGRCAVIIPEGILFGSSNAHKDIRKMLLEKCRLDAVISMPSGVFKPYAGVSTAVLVFTKGEPTKKVMFYHMESDGFSLDDKRTFIDGKGDITEIINKFQNKDKEEYSDRKNKCFTVPIKEIKDKNYDLSINNYKEFTNEEKHFESPKEILKKIKKNETTFFEILNEIDELI